MTGQFGSAMVARLVLRGSWSISFVSPFAVPELIRFVTGN
jgi:hypothetical protein